jgi:hypothetical protein
MNKLNVVFITGAGFSAEAGGPLIYNFLDRARKIYRIKGENEYVEKTRKDFELVNDVIGNIRSINSKAYLDFDNIETLLGALEIGIMIDKFGTRKGEEIEVLRDSLIKVIVTTIEYSIKFGKESQTDCPGPPEKYQKFFMKIEEFLPYCNYSFITFNYDLLLEVGLNILPVKYDYCLDRINPGDISLLKLHGSLNWYPYGNYIFTKNLLKDEENAINNLTNDDFLQVGSRLLAEYKIPFIIPPTLNKYQYHVQLKKVWERAASILSEAELVIIIGYSMPETDMFFKYLYSLGIDSPTYLYKLVVLNSDGSIQNRYKSFVSPHNDHKKFYFISGLFSQHYDQIFIEIKNMVS